MRELEALRSKYGSLLTTAKSHEEMAGRAAREGQLRAEEVSNIVGGRLGTGKDRRGCASFLSPDADVGVKLEPVNTNAKKSLALFRKRRMLSQGSKGKGIEVEHQVRLPGRLLFVAQSLTLL